jgi:tetratricopeptide (TPR) repeat protein
MRRYKALLAAGVVGLLFAGIFWRLLNPRAAPTPMAKTEPVAPPNPAHEKAMLEEQLRKKPSHAPVLLRLAQLATEQGRPAEARRHLEALLKADPSHLEARLELGRACYALNDLACATTETEKILAVDPNHADALYNLGAIHANIGQTGKAREYWNRAVRTAPSSESGKKAAAGLKQLGG